MPLPFQGDLPHPGIELESPALAGGFFTTEWRKPLRTQCAKRAVLRKDSLRESSRIFTATIIGGPGCRGLASAESRDRLGYAAETAPAFSGSKTVYSL